MLVLNTFWFMIGTLFNKAAQRDKLKVTIIIAKMLQILFIFFLDTEILYYFSTAGFERQACLESCRR